PSATAGPAPAPPGSWPSATHTRPGCSASAACTDRFSDLASGLARPDAGGPGGGGQVATRDRRCRGRNPQHKERGMPVTEEQRQQVVESAIREISHIATLPEVTLRIIELVEDPTSTAQDLHAVISNDPALSSRILKVVNSSFYGLPGQTSTITRAIVMLGLNAVKNIAIAASLAKLFRGGELTPTFSAKELWNHSNATAIGCKMLSDAMGMGLGDEAYLAGLIH